MITAPFTHMDIEISDGGMRTDERRRTKGGQQRVERAMTSVCEGRASGGGVRMKKKKKEKKSKNNLVIMSNLALCLC
jgi:hypothetical protein